MRLSYLSPSYPEVTHTFIRREVLELERRGHDVLRLAIHKGLGLVDPVDQAEERKTTHVLEQGARRLLWAALRVALGRPAAFVGALSMVWSMHRVSDRGLLRHIAYLVEACFLLDLLERHRVEHLHVHFGTNAATVARLVRRMGGPPYTMTIHGPVEFDAPAALSLGAKVEDSAATIAITSYCGAQIRRWVDHEHWPKIHIIHCTVGDHLSGEPEPIQELSRTLLCIGRLSSQKGQLLLIDAMERLANKGIDAKLVLAGDGEMRGVIERRLTAAGITDRVHVTGWLSGDQVQRYLRDCRAMVLPSFAEGLPVVIMEALAMARPVISTYVGGIVELVRPGENGWLVHAGSFEKLAGAMQEALETPAAKLNEMGQAGRRRVQAKHDTPTEVDKLEALIRACRKGT